MDILSSIQLNPEKWPIAALGFLRIVTLFFFLPIIGDKIVPASIRISLGIAFTFFCLPVVMDVSQTINGQIMLGPFNLIIATLREVFFGFCVGFFSKIIFYAASIASHTVGVNMGFQVASMFSPGMNDQESAFSNLNYWMIIILILALNVHHLFIQGIVKSFYTVPIGSPADASTLSRAALKFIIETFELAIRLAGPLITIQIIINIAMGLLNRALPSLNVFVISFPLSFLLCMLVLMIVLSSYIAFTGSSGARSMESWFETSFRLFHLK